MTARRPLARPQARMHWRRTGHRHRVVAGATSIGATALLLALLSPHAPPVRPPRRIANVAVAIRPLVDPPIRPAASPDSRLPPPAVASRETRAARRASLPASKPPDEPVATTGPAVVAAPAPVDGRAPASAPLEAASAPLRIDGPILRAAAIASVGAVHRLAERSGQSLPSRATLPADALASTISRTGKSDCLAPNEHGNLLSIPIIAFDAMTGKCK